MVNYSNGKIYKIVCTLPNIDDIYVGGTAKPKLSDRMCCHIYEAKGSKWNFKLYKFMRLHGIQNFKIELLEEYSCQSRKELGVREQYWMDILKPSLNSMPATSHRKEVCRRYDSKPESKAKARAYRLANKETIYEKVKLRIANRTPEERKIWNAKNKVYRDSRTPEQREAHLAKRKASYQRRRKAMTPEQLVAFRAKELARRKARKNKI